MDNVNESFLSDDSSEDEDGEPFQNEFDSNRASFSDYGTNRASFSFSDVEANRFSFTSDNDNPLSDQESTKGFPEFNDNNQPQSESNSEEEGKPYFQESAPPVRTGPVTFYKYGQPPKVIHKPPPTCYSNKRSLSCSDSEDQDQEEMPAKRSKFDDLARPVESGDHVYDKGKAMLEKMGYRKGEGLGKHSQGRVAPVELSKQRGRRGLGLTLPGLEPAELSWDSSMEVVSVEEVPKWLEGSHLPPLDMATLRSWQQVGPRTLNIEDFTDFCDPSILSNILSKKSIFDSLEGDEMRKARTRSNPFETIGKGIFLNRAAMKMANMDKVFGFMFTDPKGKDETKTVQRDELLYFADVCAGPGGFSEYVLWRKKWKAKGFGFTLKGENDFKLSDFISGPCESFEPFYGKKEDGDVFDPENIESLMHFVMDHTDQLGVHFMMADGGFSVDGQENIQELLSKQLYLCQFLVALCIVRTGGHFVCKLFDIFSPFSVGLVYLMYRAFDQICIHKPNTSRPANSERYIICKWKRDDCEPTREYLFNLNKELSQLNNSKDDINYCVSMDELVSDKIFYDYIVESNNDLGERQIVNLVKIAAFCRDMNLKELRQQEMRQACLRYWNIPVESRKVNRKTAEEVLQERLQKDIDGILNSTGTQLKTVEQLKAHIKSVYDWHAVPIASHSDIHFYIGLGRNRIYRVFPTGFCKKVDARNSNPLNLELSPGTMVYGEFVQEVQGQSKSQVKKMAFHIIDAISLGEENICHLHYTERLKMCQLFAKSLYKSSNVCMLKVKNVYYLQDLNHFFESLTIYLMKNGTKELLICCDDVAFQPKGIMFIKATKDPWMRHLSRSHNLCYFDTPGKPSKFDQDRPREACSPTVECFLKRLMWLWEQGVGLHLEQPEENVLHKDHLTQFIENKLSR